MFKIPLVIALLGALGYFGPQLANAASDRPVRSSIPLSQDAQYGSYDPTPNDAFDPTPNNDR